MIQMRLSREATLWNAEGEVEQVANATAPMKYIYQTLPTHAPEDAEPYTCYLNTVIFYEPGTPTEITRCDHYDLACAPSPHLLWFKGTWYEAHGRSTPGHATLDCSNLGARALREEAAA